MPKDDVGVEGIVSKRRCRHTKALLKSVLQSCTDPALRFSEHVRGRGNQYKSVAEGQMHQAVRVRHCRIHSHLVSQDSLIFDITFETRYQGRPPSSLYCLYVALTQ